MRQKTLFTIIMTRFPYSTLFSKWTLLFAGVFMLNVILLLPVLMRGGFCPTTLFADIFSTPSVAGVVTTRIYLLLLTSLVLTVALFVSAAWLWRNGPLRDWLFLPAYRQAVAPLFFGLFVCLTAVQFLMHSAHFERESAIYAGKSLEEKQRMLFRQAYEYAAGIRRQYPGPRNARIFTDLDLGGYEEMTLHRQLCYFLYPVNVRALPEGAPADLLIYLEKDPAGTDIPAGYVRGYRYNERNFVAVKSEDAR